jgi:hypothetical protein
MSCGGGHLGSPIGIKNINFVEDLPMIILYMNVHWMVLYNLHVFCSDMKFKMAATAGLSLTLDPMGVSTVQVVSEKKHFEIFSR